MGYYIRVLGLRDPEITLDHLTSAIDTEGLSARFEIDEDDDNSNWSRVSVFNAQGIPLAQIEHDPVSVGALGAQELEEFFENIEDELPASATTWLKDYFTNVKVIYAFQLLGAAFDAENYDIIATLKASIWELTGGILQADGEGFSNEDGYHILWQFSDDVSGAWNCAVLNSSGLWDRFTMELGDMQQRQEFMAGLVPQKATAVPS